MTLIDPVTREQIAEQRTKGWVDFHPEAYCHRCGRRNPTWYVPSEVWNAVMRNGDLGDGWPWSEIICPPCFAALAGDTFGEVWTLLPAVTFERYVAALIGVAT